MSDKMASKAYRRVIEEAKMIDELSKKSSVERPMEKKAYSSVSDVKKQIINNKELYDAMMLGEEFSRNRTDDGYMITEGWDIFHIMHSLVVLCHAVKGLINRGEIELVPQTKEEKSSKQP